MVFRYSDYEFTDRVACPSRPGLQLSHCSGGTGLILETVAKTFAPGRPFGLPAEQRFCFLIGEAANFGHHRNPWRADDCAGEQGRDALWRLRSKHLRKKWEPFRNRRRFV